MDPRARCVLLAAVVLLVLARAQLARAQQVHIDADLALSPRLRERLRAELAAGGARQRPEEFVAAQLAAILGQKVPVFELKVGADAPALRFRAVDTGLGGWPANDVQLELGCVMPDAAPRAVGRTPLLPRLDPSGPTLPLLTSDDRWLAEAADSLLRSGTLLRCLSFVPIPKRASYSRNKGDISTELSYQSARLDNKLIPISPPQAAFEVRWPAAGGEVQRRAFTACWRGENVAGPALTLADTRPACQHLPGRRADPPRTTWDEFFLVSFWPDL
jgi:hypothetical protein